MSWHAHKCGNSPHLDILPQHHMRHFAAPLIKLNYPMRVCCRGEAHGNLPGRLFAGVEFRQGIGRKPCHIGGFRVGMNSGLPQRGAEDKSLDDVVRERAAAIPAAVFMQRYQAPHLHLQPGFLAHLLHDIGGNGLVHIHPATRQRPEAILFAHQQDFSLVDDGGAGIQLGCLEPGFIAE